MQTGYFSNCLTMESVKARYRDLAKQHHPDLGGDTAVMQAVNAAYHAALAAKDGQVTHDAQGKAHTYHYNAERESEIMARLYDILRAVPAGVSVSLIGYWLWVTGTEKGDKATQAKLKALGCRWHSKRVCWYWRPETMRHYGKHSHGSLDYLAMRYGCRVYEGRVADDTALAVA